ncbi:MAG TPA: Maf family protein [Verrucomicrobiota bacterium]|nr:Maf family protein [Verrucomicrobiota bacterium]
MDRISLVLASRSPRRQELLRRAGLDFEVVTAPVEERDDEELTGRELALLNAYRKAVSVARRLPGRLVLGADTVVCLGTRKLGKPCDLDEAVRMLEQLQGRTHHVITGVALIRLESGEERVFAETTHVTFRPLARSEIEAYIARVNPLDKAGAYAIQEHGEMLVVGIDGSYSNVVGLPMERLLEELKRWGVH